MSETVTQERRAPRKERQRDPVRYVFAVGRADSGLEDAAGELTGPDGTPVRAVCGSGLCALVADVPAGLYDEAGLKAQLEDMERLEAVARTHDAAVAGAYRYATVLPMRLATVCLDDDRVAGMLTERQRELDGLLARLEGQVEWGVKVFADPREAGAAGGTGDSGGTGRTDGTDAPGAGEQTQQAPGGSGRAYLQRRRAQRATHRDTYRAAGAVAERVAAVAGELATARVRHRPQQGELAAGQPGENIVNDAYLLPSGLGEDFRDGVGVLAEDVPGVRVEVTGPWAPYSFATAATPQAGEVGMDGETGMNSEAGGDGDGG